MDAQYYIDRDLAELKEKELEKQRLKREKDAIRKTATEPRKITKAKKILSSESASIVTMHCAGVPVNDIARAVNRHPNAIYEHLRVFSPLFEYVKIVASGEWEIHKSSIFNAAEMLALKSVVDSLDKDEGNLQQRAVAFREIFNASRLVQNKSTSNTAVIKFTLPADIDTNIIK